MPLLLNDGPIEAWKVGKKREVIVFVLEAEACLQGQSVSGPQRKALIAATTMIKQGKWELTRRCTPQYVAENLQNLLESGEMREINHS